MKSTNQKSEKNTFKIFYLLIVLVSSLGFAQAEKPTQETIKAKTDMSSTGATTNPYFQENHLAGEIAAVAENNTNPIEITKQRTKSNNTNERTKKPNGQDDGNPFPPKSSESNVLKTKHDTAKNSVGNIR